MQPTAAHMQLNCSSHAGGTCDTHTARSDNNKLHNHGTQDARAPQTALMQHTCMQHTCSIYVTCICTLHVCSIHACIHAWSMMHTACNAPCMLDVYLYIACMLQHVCGMLVRMTLHVWCMLHQHCVCNTHKHTYNMWCVCCMHVAFTLHGYRMVHCIHAACALHVCCMCVACMWHACCGRHA